MSAGELHTAASAAPRAPVVRPIVATQWSVLSPSSPPISHTQQFLGTRLTVRLAPPQQLERPDDVRPRGLAVRPLEGQRAGSGERRGAVNVTEMQKIVRGCSGHDGMLRGMEATERSPASRAHHPHLTDASVLGMLLASSS